MDRLQRASELIATIERCEAELRQIFGAGGGGVLISTSITQSDTPKKSGMSAAGRARIAAAARARWAKIKGEANGAATTAKPAKAKKKRTMSPEARAKIAAAQKKRWAKQKAGK
jgi:hypothetical protein